MKIDGAKVKAARDIRPLSDVTHVMRKAGLDGTQASWVSMVERGLLPEIDERHATALAAALGVGLSEILDLADAPDAALLAVAGDLLAMRGQLDVIAGRLAVALAGPAAASAPPVGPGKPALYGVPRDGRGPQ